MAPRADSLAAPAIRGGVRALAWACLFLSRLMLARAIVAIAVIAASMTIAVYALWIGAILWMLTGRFGVVRSQRWRIHIEVGAASVAIAALISLCALEGRPAGNVAVIATFALGGALVWFYRDLTMRSLRAELAAVASRGRMKAVCRPERRT